MALWPVVTLARVGPALRRWLGVVMLVVLVGGCPQGMGGPPMSLPAGQRQGSRTPHRGVNSRHGRGISVKGLNYDDDSLEKAIALGFEWIKIYDYPPPQRLPFKVLYRVNLPRPDEDWEEWGHYRYLDAKLYAGRIDAYEIGNEPNLRAEWGSAPDPSAYAQLLKIAYREIKAGDPGALVVSAGLAPVSGGTGADQYDDLSFLRVMYESGAADYFDVLGVHPFGFAYPPQTSPKGQVCGWNDQVVTSGPVIERGCRAVNGLCFRRAELARAIMSEYGDADKPVWATEFGWIIRPPPCCREREDWPTRYWQAVSAGMQARYISRAFAYADANWPWMEVMFLWNLDYSRYPHRSDPRCPNCETMGWYSILAPDGTPRPAYRWLLDRRLMGERR